MLPSGSNTKSWGSKVGGSVEVVVKSPEFPPLLLIVTVLPELLITLFEVEVFTVLELLVLLITTELPVLVITLFEVAVLTLFPPFDVDVAEVLLTID